MRRKQVWRYYCEHCKKSGCSGGHLARHERGCTANPNRACGACRTFGLSAKPLSELIQFAKSFSVAGEHYLGYPDDSSNYLDEAKTKELRDLADSCPACTLAAARQSGVFLRGFDFKVEMKAHWDAFNEAQAEREYSYG